MNLSIKFIHKHQQTIMRQVPLIVNFIFVLFVPNKTISQEIPKIYTGDHKGAWFVFQNETIDKIGSTSYTANKITFKSSGRLTLPWSAKLQILTDTLVVEGPFTIDGRGKEGKAGEPNKFGSWTSSGLKGAFNVCNTGHDEWLASGTHSNDRGNNGRDGWDGAIITIKYKVFAGVNGGLGNLNVLTSGGPGGKGSSGLLLICGCHPTENKYGPSGANGAKGKDGMFTIQQISN